MEEKVVRKNNKRLFIIGAVAVAVIGIVIALVLILAGRKESLLGKWIVEKGSWYYNFTSDTRGSYGTDAYENVPDQNFTYKNNGDSFTIQYDGMVSSMDLKYRIEGDKLIITDSFGMDVVYIRQ